MKPGELIRIRAAGTSDEWTLAKVLVASENGKSAGVLLQGMVRAPGGFIAGFLPLVIDYEREYVSGLLGGEYEVFVNATPTQLPSSGEDSPAPDSKTNGGL